MNRLLMALGVSTLLLAACGGGESTSDSAGASSVAPKVDGITDTEIILGSHNDLSGPVALLGTAINNGARMRIDEANAAGGIHGRKIRWVVEDSSYQVPKAVQAANKLVNRDKVFAIVLGMGTPMNNAVMGMLKEKGIPNLFAISGARSMVEPLNPLQFTGRGVYFDESKAIVRYFIEKMGATRPCIDYQDTDYGQEVLDGVEAQLEEMGMELATVAAHKPTDSEFTATILRLRNAGCDLVVLGNVHRDTILVLEAAKKLGWTDVAFVGGNATYSNALAQLPSGAAEGYHAFNHMATIYPEDDNSPAAAAWLERWTARFGSQPEYIALEGYRSADVVIKALEMAGPNPTRQSVVAALETMSDYTDIFGYRLSFSPEDHAGVFESTLSVIKDGRWHKMAESISY